MTGAAHVSWNDSPAPRAVADSATWQGDVIDGQVAGAYTGEVSAQMLARLGARPAYRFLPVARSVKRRAVPTAEHGYFR
jgi:hypothetical protein